MTCLARCGQEVSRARQTNRFNRIVVCLEHCVGVRCAVVGNADEALLVGRGGQDRITVVGCVERTQALRVVASVDRIDQSQIGEVVHIDSILEHDHNSTEEEWLAVLINLLVFPQFDCHYLRFEREFPDGFLLMVIPEHDFVGRELWVGTTANKCKDIAPEEHLNYSDPALKIYSRVKFKS